MKVEILKRLETHRELPEYPALLHKLDQMLRDPNAETKMFVDLLSTDAGLVGRILRMANSVWYAAGGLEVSTLSAAIGRLGLTQLRRIVYGSCLVDNFSKNKLVSHASFWRHCLAVGILAQRLSERNPRIGLDPEQAYIAGLFHDVGIMLFAVLEPKKYAKIVRNASNIEDTIDKAEMKAFGLDHAELGSEFILLRWRVSLTTALAVRFHHDPFASPVPSRPLAVAVHLASAFCENEGISNGVTAHQSVFEEGAWEYLGLSLEETKDIYQGVQESIAQSELQIME